MIVTQMNTHVFPEPTSSPSESVSAAVVTYCRVAETRVSQAKVEAEIITLLSESPLKK